MKNIVAIGLLMILLSSGFVFATYDRSDEGVKLMSEDDYNNNIHIKYYSNPSVIPMTINEPNKSYCQRDEWNNNFEKFRSEKISKEYMIDYIGGCKS